MKYKAWLRLIRKHPHKDLNEKVIAYDIDGTPLGEVVFKEGVVISRKNSRRSSYDYNRRMLEEWSKMPDWGDYIITNGGLTSHTSREGFQFLQNEYYTEVKRRISYCKFLEEKKDALICYTLAELYDRCNEDESPAYVYKWLVRYYAICALEIDRNYADAKELLKRVEDWIEPIEGDKEK